MKLKNAIRKLMDEYSMVTKLVADEVVMALARLLTIEEEAVEVANKEEPIKPQPEQTPAKLTMQERMAKMREARNKNKQE